MKWILPFVFLLLMSCSSQSWDPLSEAERERVGSAGGSSDLLQQMLAASGNGKIDSMQVYKNGQLVLERYGDVADKERLHDLRSSTKAITSLLVGIAIDRGYIGSVDDPILRYFPERTTSHPQFAEIRIRDLLTMRSGLDSNDWDGRSPGNEELMYKTDSWVDFFFSLSVVDAPGERFRYSTAGVVVLGELVARASGMPFDTFADTYLFRDLGIESFEYEKTPAGEVDAGGHLRLRPTDFAKIGLLMLNQGVWGEKRVVSEEWIGRSVAPAVKIPGAGEEGPYMGYLWWQEPVTNGKAKSFQSRGNGGQYLIAIPSKQILGVFTGSAYNNPKQFQPFLLMRDYVIPAFEE